MKYITKLILENFQSHKYSELVFNGGMNVIIGPSDSGKSAIIRALKWVLYNEPSGDYFIRENENQCSVTIHTNDGFILKRYRTRSKNGYSLTYPNGEELTFEGIGNSVPNEIVETIGIQKIQLDSDESASINIGEQLEGPFLLSEKTSTRANAIGRLVGVNILDDAIKETAKDIKNINSKKKNLEESLDNINNELESFNYLDQLTSTYKELKDKLNLLEYKNKKLEKLLTLKSNLNSILSNKKNAEAILNNLKNLYRIETLFEKLSKELIKYYNFEKTHEKLTFYNQKIMVTEKILNSLIDLSKVDRTYNNLGYKIKSYNEFTLLYAKYNKLKKDKNIYMNLMDSLEHIDQVNNIYNDLYLKTNTYLKILQYNSRLIEIKKKIHYIYQINDRLNKFTEKTNIEEITLRIKLLVDLVSFNNKILKLQKDITRSSEIIKKLNEDMNTIVYKYKNILSKYEKCPYCLSDINKDKIEHIIKYHLGG
ncbi:hypothetical protein E4100_07140 [Soehngenia longivitae]|uniref:Nuclease SbcCD subunit C n=1 Tax=Soehngenia longivitae TaxID=2562294 RepID=A0A4Z0D220_9FIRM|nr:AAA family ATPase [Soehngenia longivitae]TFZ39801.1 hypothetical protein E4100_07140 [Soehngenia longivitae]